MLKKIIIGIVILLFVGGGAYLVLKPKSQPEYITQALVRGQLKQTVDATGKVESAEKINLNFKITGRLAELLVQAGDQVKSGQKLASLDNGILRSKIADAQAKLNQTQADFDKILAGASAEDIRVAEDNVTQKEQNLLSAQNDLANLKVSRNTELDNLKETAITTLNNEIVTAQGALDEIDNTLNDPDAKFTLSAENSDALIDALNSENEANRAITASKNTINSITSSSSDNEVLTSIDKLKNTLNLASQALSDTLDVLSATITSTNLSESELDTLKSNIKAQQVKINTAKTNVQTAKANWTNKQVYYRDQITQSQDNIEAAAKTLQKARSELVFKKSPPRQFEIDASKAKVDQANANLALAQAKLDETIIRAPIDGTVIKTNYEVGEQTSLTRPVLEIISQSQLQIEVDIPESDIAKVKIGQQTEITLDAFGDEEIFAGTVSFVDPAETVIQDVVYYKIKVQFAGFEEKIKPGMTANITIITNSKDNVLWVPTRAVKTADGEKYVEILENGIAVQKIITTGLRGDLGVEILSGLNEGDKVITFTKEE